MQDLNLLVVRMKACEDDVTLAQNHYVLAEQALGNARAALADAVRDFDEAVQQVKHVVTHAITPDAATHTAHEMVAEAIAAGGTPLADHVTRPINPRAGFDPECDDDRREEGITVDG